MRIDANVYPLQDKGQVKAMATILVSGQFVITGIRLMAMANGTGYYIKMPSYRSQGYDEYGRPIYKDHVVLSKELYAAAREQITDKYEDLMQGYELDTVKPEDLAYPVPEVTVTKLQSISQGKCLAEVSIRIGGQVYVNGIRVMTGKNDIPFVAMPAVRVLTKAGQQEFRDVCFPVTGEMRAAINTAVLGDYLARKDLKIKEEDMVIELHGETGECFYWHYDSSEMFQVLYKEDFTMLLNESVDMPFDEFVTEAGCGCQIITNEFLACDGKEVIQCMQARQRALLRGEKPDTELSPAEKEESRGQWYFRIGKTNRYAAVRQMKHPQGGLQVQVKLLDEAGQTEAMVTGMGENMISAVKVALQKKCLDYDPVAVPRAYYYKELHQRQKEVSRWKDESRSRSTIRR